MPSKIFISYRREDTAANALGIGQYLEHQFGRKNVFIDVDMRAGTKFPDVLQQRLAECKVLLALIGPGWLSAHDEKGGRRLDNSADWVRLEIAHALRRGVTVIPVRVNGAALPTGDDLPDDIRGLLDHQAVSVTTTGFRNEMAGLARDIRAIPSARGWRRLAMAAAGILVVLAASALIYSFGLQKFVRHPTAPTSPSAKEGPVWSSKPGEWVMFAVDKQPIAYYFKPSSVETFGDNTAFTERVPTKTISTSVPSDQTAVYEDTELVVSCKDALWAQAEITYYDRAGGIVSHFKQADPASLNLSKIGQKINSGSILAVAQHTLCDKTLHTPLATKEKLVDDLLYLSPSPSGDSDFYSLKDLAANLNDRFESSFVTKWHEDQPYANLFPGQIVLGLPLSYRTQVERLQGDCSERRIQVLEIDRFDTNGEIVDEFAPIAPEPINVTKGSSLDFWLDRACSALVRNVGGTYEGTDKSTYKLGGEAEQKITVYVVQSGDELTVNFQTPTGAQGKGTGKLSGDTVKSLTLQRTAPDCPGSYKGSMKFDGDTMSWSYAGSDCGGSMEGRGTAKRTKT